MEFGALIFTKPDRIAHDVRYAEARGFSHAWIPDSHMIWGDVYACMAIAAVNTTRIKLGTGVAVASNRIAPVTVHSIATINQLAPGRTILGFGTGHTGRRVMGLPPVRHEDFREQVRIIHDLLKSGEATYHAEGRARRIRYLHRDRRFINLDNRIPFYVAANGPKTLALAGEFGDGIITTGIATTDRVADVRRHAQVGAAAANRDAATLPIVSLNNVCILKSGEAVDSPRVKAMTGHWVMASFHAIAAGYASPHSLPAPARKVYDAYADQVAKLKTPPAERYLDIHIGHCSFVSPEEQKFVTAETIAATAIVGSKEAVVDRIRELDKAGLSQMFLNPPMDRFDEYLDDISRDLIERV